MKRDRKTASLTQIAILVAIEAIFCFTPLGSIPMTSTIVATTAAIPIIVAGILLGPLSGAIIGFAAGLFSFIVWTFMPPSPVMAFVFTPFHSFGDVSGNFWSLVICFVPRILVGVVAGLCFKGFSSLFKHEKSRGKEIASYSVSAVLGSMTNTLLVVGGIVLFFGGDYAKAFGVSYDAMLGLVATSIYINGVIEAIIASLVAYAVCKPLKKYMLVR